MARRGKKKTNATSGSSRHRQPKIVEEVADSDDEEIDEDEAFNSEDERLYGQFFQEGSSGVKGGGSDDEISSDDEDDSSGASDQEDDDDDGGQYMLSLLDKLDSVGKKKADQSSGAQMTNVAESEYSSSISKKGLTLDNLMEGLEDTHGFKNLQKTFAKQQSATPAPLDKVKSDRVQRKLAYESQSKNVSRWTKVVQENRQAETLDFKPKERLNVTRDTLVDKFEATTDFEKELEQALEEAGQQDEEAVLKAEEQALQDDLGANRLTMEEYKKRRGQLAQVRALMFYHEQKRHHMKKIKSKKYRKIRKRQRERLKESAMEAAMEEDEELAKELKEKEEVSRVQERMTLAHKNTSKWAKRILKRGKNVDMETRRALSAQIKRGDDLRRKMMGDDSDASDNDSDEDLVDSARKVLADTEEDADPTKGKSGLFKLSFMQKGIQKQREQAREEARKLLAELEANEMSDGDFEDAESEAIEEDMNAKKRKKAASEKEMEKVLPKGALVAQDLEFGNSNTISTSSGIEIDISTKTQEKGKSSVDSTRVESNLNTIEDSATLEVQNHAKKVKKAVDQVARTPKGIAKASIVSTAPVDDDEEESNPWLQASEPADGQNSNKKPKKVSKGMVDIEGAVEILDRGNKIAKTQSVHSEKESNVTLDEGEKKITMLSQEELVKRAFATPSEDQVDEEFEKEKEALVIENDPTRKVEDTSKSKEVAGWGSWTGAGAPPPPKWKKNLPKKLQAPKKKNEPKRKRKDDGKRNVIINQKRLKKTANAFMLGDVPHPFSSRAEYERAMMGGVGSEWNVTSSVKALTRPEILTRSGKIIMPITKKAKVARAPAKF